MTRRRICPPPAAASAARALGVQIRLARAELMLTAAALGEAAQVSARTVTAIERGDPSVSIGNVLTVAACVGVAPFGADVTSLLAEGEAALARVPARVRPTDGPRR